MKKFILSIVIILLLIPNNLKSQDNNRAEAGLAVAAGLLAIGSGIAATEQLKEQMELKAVEEILFSYPDIKNFQLKTSSLDGTSMKDMSDAGVVTYEIQIIGGERLVLFLFTSTGWSNQYGLDFNRVKWKLFNRKEWLNLMKAFVETASRKEVSIEELSSSDITRQGLKNGKEYILEFDKMRGDVYYTMDYSDEFKVVFNEKSMGLYIKQSENENSDYRRGGVRGDLVQIRRNAITRAHNFLNFK